VGCVLDVRSLAAALAFSAAFAAEGHASGRALCSNAGLSVIADFERARATACRVDDERRVEVRIEPEAVPINDSAWYAFKIQATTPGPVQITLRYRNGTHRYRPKVSTDGHAWRAIEDGLISVGGEGAHAAFSVDVAAGETIIAAQPLETNTQALDRWQDALVQRRLLRTVIGRSVDGAPIYAFATPAAATRYSLVLLGRQHPPETTGGVAFDAFLQRLLEDDATAQGFRQGVAILAFPVLNPDGLARGHWRTNTAGLDLNRDWGPLTQPETNAAARAIDHVVRNRPMIGLIDFHSTRRDVIYAQPAGDPLFPSGLAEDWFARWKVGAGQASPAISRSHDATQLNAKTWSRLRFGVSGVTYEVGDNTDLVEVRRIARLSAEAYMDAFLNLTAERLVAPAPAPSRSVVP
jgi:hypothetical protein